MPEQGDQEEDEEDHALPLEDGHHKSMLAGSNVQSNLTTTYEGLT
jgi:hypothetical protein